MAPMPESKNTDKKGTERDASSSRRSWTNREVHKWKVRPINSFYTQLQNYSSAVSVSSNQCRAFLYHKLCNFQFFLSAVANVTGWPFSAKYPRGVCIAHTSVHLPLITKDHSSECPGVKLCVVGSHRKTNLLPQFTSRADVINNH